MPYPGKRGFTLVEMIVAVTIFSLIAVGIGTSIVSGLRIWNNVKNVNFSRAIFILDMDAVAGDLYRSIEVPSIDFEGKATEFSFPTISKDGVVKMTYIYDRERKTLLKRETSLKELLSDSKEKAYSEKEVAYPEELSFEYFDINKDSGSWEWKDAWAKEKGVFTGIRVKGKRNGEEFIKTIFLPISKKQQ